MHYFVAFDRQDAGDPLFIADINNAGDEARLRIRRDTLNKAIDIARRLYGETRLTIALGILADGICELGSYLRVARCNCSFNSLVTLGLNPDRSETRKLLTLELKSEYTSRRLILELSFVFMGLSQLE